MGGHVANEGPEVAEIGRVEDSVVLGPRLDGQDHWGEAGLHQDQVEQKAGRPPVAVYKWMDDDLKGELKGQAEGDGPVCNGRWPPSLRGRYRPSRAS